MCDVVVAQVVAAIPRQSVNKLRSAVPATLSVLEGHSFHGHRAELGGDMLEARIELDVIAYSPDTSACEKGHPGGGAARTTDRPLGELLDPLIEPGTGAGQRALALSSLSEMLDACIRLRSGAEQCAPALKLGEMLDARIS